MRNEIIELLKQEGEPSCETINEIDIHDFSNLVKEIGKKETDYIKASEISDDLDTEYVGQDLYVYHEVGSTNTIAKFLSMNDVENGSVIISEKQTNGRGRSGKTWQSPIGGVWLSIVLHPKADPSKIPIITLATGVAVAKTLETIGIANPEIKWPNDVMVNGKKICGILTETATNSNTLDNVIIGVGINVNLDTNQFPEELKEITTTLEKELGRKTDENLLIRIFLKEFEKIAELFDHAGYEEILKEWRIRSYTIGKTVEVREPYNNYYDGYVVGIDKEGALIVEKNDGTLKKVISGECIIKS